MNVLESAYDGGIISLVVLLVIGLFLLAFFIYRAVENVKDRECRDFVSLHSEGYRAIKEINKQYRFKAIPSFDMVNSYDNENFYNEISTRDYLTYELVYHQKKINQALKDSLENNELYKEYVEQIRTTVFPGHFDEVNLPKDTIRLGIIEKEMIEEETLKPTVNYKIKVRLTLTNINGDYRMSKCDYYYPKEIKEIISKINQKRGSFYLNEDVWHSLCRVERGKVSNRMRFAIYERDGYRCRKCHKKTDDLEVDHIIPIAKGGKSTFDNLQTLCHRCNVKKGANIE